MPDAASRGAGNAGRSSVVSIRTPSQVTVKQMRRMHTMQIAVPERKAIREKTIAWEDIIRTVALDRPSVDHR